MAGDRKLFSTRHFTWLHVPKTGGTWLHRVMSTHAPPSWKVSVGRPSHVLIGEVPIALEHWNKKPDRVGLPILATVRNPWDWYVSLYFFIEQHRSNCTGGFAGPRSTWSSVLTMWADYYGRGNTVRGFRLALPKVLEGLYEQDFRVVGVQSLFLRNPDGSLGVRPVRFEGLRENMVSVLESVGAEVTPQLRDGLLRSPKIKTSGHCAYAECYDDMTRKLVERYEGWIIDTFGYTF